MTREKKLIKNLNTMQNEQQKHSLHYSRLQNVYFVEALYRLVHITIYTQFLAIQLQAFIFNHHFVIPVYWM